MAATAAGTFSGFQAVCSGNMHIPAVTATFPPGPAVFTFQFFYCHKFPETPACKVFCHRVLSWHCFPEYIHSPLQSHASDVWYLLLSHFQQSHLHSHTTYLFSRSFQFFQYRQMTKSLTFQFKSVCHPLSLTFRQKKRCGRNFSCRTACPGSCYLSVFFFLLTNTAASNTTHPETQITAIHFAMFVLSPVFGIAFT